jgi:hypothetical protein
MLAACRQECAKLVESMREARPDQAERIRVRLNDLFKSQPKLASDFKRKTLATARIHECAVYTRAVDAKLHESMTRAKANDLEARNRLVGEANAFARKAALCGAGDDFQAAVERRIEIIMMTGDGKFGAKPAKHPAH